MTSPTGARSELAEGFPSVLTDTLIDLTESPADDPWHMHFTTPPREARRVYRCESPLNCPQREVSSWYLLNEITTDTWGSLRVCTPCRADRFWVCLTCDEGYAYNQRCQACDTTMGYNPDPDDGCDRHDDCDCDDHRRSEGEVFDYSYKPRPVFHGDGPVYLGLELEVSAGPYGDSGPLASLANTHLGTLGYLKEDSSVSNGWEVVTHPMTYAYALESFPWVMLAELDRQGAEADESCGLHVHVSRAAFASESHAYRWMKLFHRNRHDITRLARRDSSQWAAFTARDRANVKDYVKGAAGDRYSAINTRNDTTYEIRVFASSLAEREVKAALALVDASVRYTRDLSTREINANDGWSFRAFARWVAERPEYTPLTEEIKQLCAY